MKGERPLSEFIAKVDSLGIKERGRLRWRIGRLVGKARVRWWFFWNGHKPVEVSQAAFDAVSADGETIRAITRTQEEMDR
jgi:hypothetical protein